LWEETGNISEACRKAHVGRGTFYYWKPRFDKEGYDGLTEFESHAPDNPSRIEPEVEQAVTEMKQAHPAWGKKRIAQDLAKSNNWVPLVSPNTVKRILKEAGQEWPGRVFEDEQLSYEEAMLKFVTASEAKEASGQAKGQVQTQPSSLRKTKQSLKKEEKQLQHDRRQVREQRKLEDSAWKRCHISTSHRSDKYSDG